MTWVPLPLDSARWLELKAHFGNAGVDGDLPSLPSLLARWNHAVGSYAEEYLYQDIFESYLHQNTILDVAYAVVPHLAARLPDLDPDRRSAVLDDLACVETTRQVPPEQVEAIARDVERTVPGELGAMLAQNTRDRHPALPEDLASAYLAAIAQAKATAGVDWGCRRSEEAGPQHFRRHVRYLRNAGWTDDDIRFGVDELGRTSDEGALVLRGTDQARGGLRAADAPAGWFERTGLRGTGEPEHLSFLALYALAWLAMSVDTETMLRAEPEAR